MGTPVPPAPPWADGDDCPHCFGVGKEFGDIPTPEIVEVTFENIQATDCTCVADGKTPIPAIPSPLILYLTQHPTVPCRWHYNPEFINLGWDSFLEWHLPTNKSYLQLRRKRIGKDCNGDPHTFFDYLFYDFTHPICSTFFDDNFYVNACGGIYGGYEGQGTIWWEGMP